jgi:hypothetical protein
MTFLKQNWFKIILVLLLSFAVFIFKELREDSVIKYCYDKGGAAGYSSCIKVFTEYREF